MKKIKLLIAAHKLCELPKDSIYLPVQVGKALDKGTFCYSKVNSPHNYDYY